MNVYSVSQVNGYLKNLMDRDQSLSALFVRGEISNYKAYPSGHHYFSLKDAGGALRCVMFRREAESLRFRPQNGMEVIAFGRVSVFPRDGQYQLYCSRLTAGGLGDLHLAFEQRKQQLYRQGLFDPAHKRPLPPYPGHIVLVTSPAGAAVRDMLRILGARWPLARVTILPVRVQGEQAAGEIAAALRQAGERGDADLIITGRGGGSMEDLWAFNEEVVARAIYDCPVPVISAVGHEPDVTIADFVADLRAATPSNAAELAVPDQDEVRQRLRQLSARMARAVERRIGGYRAVLDRYAASRALKDPENYLQDRRMLLDHQQRRLASALSAAVAARQRRMAAVAAALDALSPLKVLGRGYAIARTEGGAVLSSVERAVPGARFRLRVRDGEIPCRIEEEEEGNGGEEAGV